MGEFPPIRDGRNVKESPRRRLFPGELNIFVWGEPNVGCLEKNIGFSRPILNTHNPFLFFEKNPAQIRSSKTRVWGEKNGSFRSREPASVARDLHEIPQRLRYPDRRAGAGVTRKKKVACFLPYKDEKHLQKKAHKKKKNESKDENTKLRSP
jgi:hypothetical protein